MRRNLLLLLLAGCVTAKSFPAETAKTYCKAIEQCFPDEFESEYDNMKGCRDDIEGANQAIQSCFRDACTFDAKDAGECLDGIRDASCGSLPTALAAAKCQSVWDDCDAFEVGVCLALNGVSFDTGF